MKKILIFIFIILANSHAWACTSFIISGKATPSGRPMMFKHRDTGELNNRIAHYKGPKYAFMGLVNSPMKDREVWAGMNEAGFCIMNTASYNLREDSLQCKMDREGELMYHALGICATLADFEAWLETYPQPWGVEANFGIIDAEGGAAYYEMNNQRYIKYDVNQETDGYRVVTNFSFAGRYEEYEGWERYLTAQTIMQDAFDTKHQMSAIDAINLFSRQYKHELLEVEYNSKNAPKYIADQDFIPRRITSAVVVFDGIKPGENPNKTIMWTLLGYPACGMTVPLLMQEDHTPTYMLARNPQGSNTTDLQCEACDLAMEIKNKWVFPMYISNGQRYIALQNILQDTEQNPSILTCIHNVEQQIMQDFIPIYTAWTNGEIKDNMFFEQYDLLSSSWLKNFQTSFKNYLE
jgi:hypothetical protein